MKLRIFSIFDVKAGAFIAPFFLPEVGMATRAFGDCVRDPKHQFGAHPEDYSLHRLGEFDDSNGIFETVSPVLVCSGLSLVKESES